MRRKKQKVPRKRSNRRTSARQQDTQCNSNPEARRASGFFTASPVSYPGGTGVDWFVEPPSPSAPANARKKPRPKSGLGAHFCSQVSATRLALSGHQVSVVIGTCGFAMFTDQSLPGIRLPALPPSFSCAVETGTPPLGNTLHSPYHGLSYTKCFLVEVRGFEPLSDTRQIQRDYND